MKRVVVMALLTASYFTTNAQTDAKAKVILDDLSAKTKTYTTIKAEFSFVTEKKDKTKDTQNGKVQIKDANEVQIKDMETGGEDAINPSTIFTYYEKGFKYKLDGEDATTQTISLFPTNPDKKKFHTAKLIIEKAKKQISSLKMLMKDGTSQTYSIKSFTTNTPVADSDFVFDPKTHAGVSIEDLR